MIQSKTHIGKLIFINKTNCYVSANFKELKKRSVLSLLLNEHTEKQCDCGGDG